jgi:hypothetical protein
MVGNGSGRVYLPASCDQTKAAEDRLAKADAAVREVDERRAALAELLEERKKESPPAPADEIAELEKSLRAAEVELLLVKVEQYDARRDLQEARVRDRKKKSPLESAASRVAGITDAASRFADDPLGAMTDMIFGAQAGGWPDGPVYLNVPLDPADFLGQTCSLRVSRDLADEPEPYSARYLTGVVVEIDDLGITVPPGASAAGQRCIRLALAPELTKLALRRDHRVFNEMSALQIVREVLRSAGVYGFAPDIPGVGAALGALSGLVEQIPFVGAAMSDALSGQFIRTLPPVAELGPVVASVLAAACTAVRASKTAPRVDAKSSWSLLRADRAAARRSSSFVNVPIS